MLISGLVLVFYFWSLLASGPTFSDVVFIDGRAAVAAGLTLVFSLVSYRLATEKWLLGASLTSYIGLLIVICLLLANTGDITSPFIGLWMIAVLISPVFGWLGIVPVAATLASFIVWGALNGTASNGDMVLATVLTGVPILIGGLSARSAKVSDDLSSGQTTRSSHQDRLSGRAEVVISAIADGVLALDSRGTIQLINPAAQKLIGWGKEDAVGLDYKSVLKIIDPRDKPIESANDPVRQALEVNKPTHVDAYSLETAEATKKFLASITVSPIGALGAGVIVVFRDITNEKAEEREQAEFISTASHEMRTPVASIEGYLGLALNPQTAQIDDKAREYIGKAQEAAKHLGRLFQDLLDVSRADDGRLSNSPRVVDVVPFLGDIVQGLAPKAIEKGLRINYKPNPEFLQSEPGGERTLRQIMYVNVDNDHLREVFANLVENAIKYTPAGEVTIDAEGDDQHVTISIADSGIGIPKEDIAHLFQKFYRVDNTETREIGGTGLGLYLCRKLTEAMGGQIWAESQYKQGSTFYIRFPRVDYVEAKELIEKASLEQENHNTPITPIHPVTSSQLPQMPTPKAPQTAAHMPNTASMATQPPQPVASPQPTAPTSTPVQPIAVPAATNSPPHNPVPTVTPQNVPQPVAPSPAPSQTPVVQPTQPPTTSPQPAPAFTPPAVARSSQTAQTAPNPVPSRPAGSTAPPPRPITANLAPTYRPPTVQPNLSSTPSADSPQAYAAKTEEPTIQANRPDST